MLKSLLAPVVLLGFAEAAGAQTAVPLKDAVPHITTTGEASAEVVPDLADLRLGVTSERPTAAAATDETVKAAKAVVDEIKARGIDLKDIKTNFEISARYDVKTDDHGRETNRTLRGYAATERVTVRVRDISKAGPLARQLIEKGANLFQGIDFSYSKEKEKRRDLDATAIRDALAEAKTYTDAIGLKLGRVLQIGDEAEARVVADLPTRRAPPVNSSVAIPTEPGIQTLRQSVTVIWQIEGTAR